MLRFLTAGESHGMAEFAVLEGIPAGLSLSVSDIQPDLERRRSRIGRGGRGKIETDKVKILSGVRLGKTLGSPITLLVKNQDYTNWQDQMTENIMPNIDIQKTSITNPRPGHADLAGCLKFQFDDARNIIERASARETVMRVAIGAVCRKFLKEFGIKIVSRISSIGADKLGTKSNNINAQIEEIINQAKNKGDTLGGVIEILILKVPPGLGSHIQWDKRLDGKLAQALMSIPSVKAIEIGEGIDAATRFGSVFHDKIFWDGKQFFRKTNNAGGIEGGISNGENITCRIFFKPLSSLANPLSTVDIKTKKRSKAHQERSDICVIPRAGVIGEAMVAFIIAHAFLEKFAGDSIEETKRNYTGYMRNLI